MLDNVRRAADGLIALSAVIGAAAILVEVGLIFADVIMRATGAPITGRQDMSQMAMILVVFGGMALCDRRGGHIVMDVLEPRFPAWLNRGADIAGAVLGAIVFAAIAWAMWGNAQISMMLPRTTNILNLPIAWFQLAIVAFSIVTALGLTLRAVEMAFRGRNVQAEAHE